MYSSIEGNWGKAPRIRAVSQLLHQKSELEKVYYCKPKKETKVVDIPKEQMVGSRLPTLFTRVTGLFTGFFPIPGFFGYLAGEAATGLAFKRRLMRDGSNIVFLKPRPFSLVSASKRAGKVAIIEGSEMHPRHTQSEYLIESREFGIRKEYIFSYERSVSDFERSINLSDKIVVFSKESLRSYEAYNVPSVKLSLINPGFDPSIKRDLKPYSTCHKGPDEDLLFVSTAFHSLLKGTHRLLLAWEKARIKNGRLLLIGDLQDDMREFVERYGPFHNVEYLGTQPRDKILSIYRSNPCIGVLLSLSEGYARSVLEYLLAGLPVIVSPAATCDIVIDGSHGFVADPRNMDVVKNALCRIYDDRLLYESLRQSVASLSIPDNTDYALSLVQLLENIIC